MGHLIWLLLCTIVGTLIGHFGFQALWLGMLIGFLFGLSAELGLAMLAD